MRSLMIQGTSSGAGKTTMAAALCRIFSDRGYDVVPFKSQNMSNFGYATPDFEISRAQAVQAIAARCEIVPDLNPIMLKPLGNYYSAVYLNGRRYGKMHAKEYYAKFVKKQGIRAAADSLDRLRKNHDLVILEGAGSPAEINLQQYDIANMQMARRAGASVILVSDIDRGGAFASLAGTMALVEKKYQKLVKGFVFNKFRGDIGVLKPGYRRLSAITKVPVLGTVPLIKTGLPEEDSLGARPKKVAWTKQNVAKIDKSIGKLAKTVKDSLDIRAVERMIK